MGVGVGQHPPTHIPNRYSFDLTPAKHLHLWRRVPLVGEKGEESLENMENWTSTFHCRSIEVLLWGGLTEGEGRDGRPCENRSRKGREYWSVSGVLERGKNKIGGRRGMILDGIWFDELFWFCNLLFPVKIARYFRSFGQSFSLAKLSRTYLLFWFRNRLRKRAFRCYCWVRFVEVYLFIQKYIKLSNWFCIFLKIGYW